MAGVFPNETTIYIVAANTNASSLASSDAVKGEISSWSQSGFGQKSDYKNLFGGQLEIEKPREAGEMSFDVSVNNAAASTLDRWDTYNFSDGTSASETQNKMVYIGHYTGGKLKVLALNNVRVTTGDTEMNADEELMKSVTLECASTTPLGTANLRTSTIAGSTLEGNDSAFLNGVWSSN